MLRRLWFPLLLGLAGLAVLLSLGVWQMQRLTWKEAILDRIDATIAAEPTPLPATVDPEADRYRPVTVSGTLDGTEVHVLTSAPTDTGTMGPGFRVIARLLTEDGRRILVDLGVVRDTAKDAPRTGPVTVSGNLHWPDEADRWTPEPDRERNVWFARDVDAMADALATERVLVVARSVTGTDLGTTPAPVDSSAISNNHRQYAITWFSLAAVWVAMTALLIRRSLKARP